MRRSAAFVGIACALAACGEREPPSRQRPEERAPAAPASAAAPLPAGPVPAPTGDRHARAAARRSLVVKRIDGKVARSDERAVVVGAPHAPPITLRVDPATAVTLDGRPSRAEALPRGADVRADYRTGDGGRPAAITIEARRAPEPARGETGAPAEQRPASPPEAESGPQPAAPWEGSPDLSPPDGG